MKLAWHALSFLRGDGVEDARGDQAGKMKIILSFSIMIAVFCIASTADELLVPDEYATISDAVAASTSGDVIRLVSQEVEWGGPITIENKNLTIEGAEEYERVSIKIESRLQIDENWNPIFDSETKTLRVIDSRVHLKNIQISKPVFYFRPGPVTLSSIPAPMIVNQNGSIEIENCSISCPFVVEGDFSSLNSELLGYSFVSSFPYNSITNEIPSVVIQDAEDRDYEFITTRIVDEGYNALEIRNLLNCSINIQGSVFGGTRRNEGARGYPSAQGGHGVYISNCQNLELYAIRIYGGDCSVFGYALSGGLTYENGGSGLFAENSTIFIKGGSFYGGNSRDADISTYKVYDAGNGGDGIHLVNSDVIYDSYSATGGRGGAGAVTPNDIAKGGKNGDPVWMDDASTFRSIDNDTGVANWPLHE